MVTKEDLNFLLRGVHSRIDQNDSEVDFLKKYTNDLNDKIDTFYTDLGSDNCEIKNQFSQINSDLSVLRQQINEIDEITDLINKINSYHNNKPIIIVKDINSIVHNYDIKYNAEKNIIEIIIYD